MLMAVVSGFGLALIAPWLHRLLRDRVGWLLALLPLGIFVYVARFGGSIAAGQPVTESYAWAPGLGLNLSFYVDGLGMLMALLVSGIGALVVIYAGGYLQGDAHLGRFYMFLLLFMASMLGLVVADNVLTLFVFWELTSISSYLLIGYKHKYEASRAAALQALLITGGGGLALLAGLVLLGLIGGSFELSELLNRSEAVQGSPLYLPMLLCVLLGAFTKSAQMPFHFWLPGAMEAPTPVSAYLHSATMVKAGVYLLLRLNPIVGGTGAWLGIVTTVGALTMAIGGILALYQTDLKRILAYSTISALGTLMLLIGLGSSYAIKAAIVFLLAHALYKGALFMIAGAVDHATGTRDVERLGGLRRVMPVTAFFAVLAAVSLAGFGPVVSFIAKELLLEAVLEAEQARWILIPVAVLAGALFVGVAAIVTVKPFFGRLQETPHAAHEVGPSLWFGPGLLALIGLVMGVVPDALERTLISPAVSAVLGRPETVDLYLFAGFNAELALSITSVALGLGLYAGWTALRDRTGWLEVLFGWGPSRWYGASLDGLNWLARAQTQRLQSGYLRRYLRTIILTLLALVGFTLLTRAEIPRTLVAFDIRLYEVALGALILLSAFAVIFARSRLSAVATLGIVGYGIALFFVLYGAPDLAMTQVMIETLTVILFVFVFYHLPRFQQLSLGRNRLRDAIIATLIGGLITGLVLVATATPPDSQVARYYAENSQPVAQGSNIVNVILVDFRGLDTLGEITVLAVAAIGVVALLKLRPSKVLDDAAAAGQQRVTDSGTQTSSAEAAPAAIVAKPAPGVYQEVDG
jgi:multicomponent Na+:H+ antiporter subunit A